MPEEREFHTKAGVLSGVISERVDNTGNLLSCMLNRPNKISIHGEIYIPKYSNEDVRTRYRAAMTFYKSGEIKSVYLEKQQEIQSPVGRMKAELVSFYRSGRILRIFPVYGQISGYWSEGEEAEMLTLSEVEVGGQKIKAKISCICFYESGAVKSSTLFPGEMVTINTPAGEVKVRYGISFYESGSIESVEPDKPTNITFGTCTLLSYDNHPIGIHGDKNSLGFYEEGTLKTLKTTITTVVLTNENEKIHIEPESRISQTDIDKMEIVPITLEFYEKDIKITDSDGLVHEFNLERYSMKTVQSLKNLYKSENCTNCSGCNSCS